MASFARIGSLLTALTLNLSALAQSNTRNFVLTRTYTQRNGIEANGNTYAGSPGQVSTSITYFDGLGQPIQQVAPFANPAYQDLISQTQYDTQFRPDKTFLLVAASPGNNGQWVASPSSAYYNSGAVCAPTPNAFTQSVYELSPLNRASETKAPGVSGNGVRQAYLTNAASSVKYYSTSGSSLYALNLGGGYYAAGTLNYTETQDENDKTVQEFRDSYNRVVLKRVVVSPQPLDTYYVYGESGLLRAVFQPLFQDAPDASLYAFLYEYDSRGRLYKKKVPGAGEVTLSYDSRDRLTGMLDALNRQFYYVYDELNRQTEMGLTVSGTNNALLYNYYDNYSASGWAAFVNELNLTPTDHFVNAPMTDSRLGLLTGSSVRMLNADGTLGNWQRSVVYYDNKGRLIQTVRELFGLGAGATERVSQQLDFVGRVVLSRTTQLSSALAYRLEKNMGYDPAGRLSYVGHNVYEGIASIWTLKKSYNHSMLAYNEVGQLSQKKLHTRLISQAFSYTPRGWLCSQSSVNDNTGSTYLTQSLTYDPNGNISTQSSNNGLATGGASYSYDGVNRLTGYSTTGSWAGYNESGLSYDKNGNLLSLNRYYGGSQTNALTYSYAGTGNRLNQVEDGAGNIDPAKGFTNGGSSAANEMGYDAAGNLNKDLNRNILAGFVQYNVLNLARQIIKGGQVVTYDYDAEGTKRQVTAAGTGNQLIYEGAFEYTGSGTLGRINLEEGQLIHGATGVDTVHYYLKDHLGNVRGVIKEDGSVLQRTAYYAFGLPMLQWGTVDNNKYLTTGKELQPLTNWLDFGARMYDPTIGRWMVVDGASEFAVSTSGYTYAGDDPVNYVDSEGGFRIDPAFARQYPTLAKIIGHYLPMAKDNPQVIQALMSQFGYKDKNAFVGDFEYGSGPWITPTRPEVRGLGTNGNPAYDFDSSIGAKYSKEFSDNIFISNKTLNELENTVKNKDINHLGEVMFEVTGKILHEYAHYLNFKKNGNEKALRIEAGTEIGAEFERRAFGDNFSYRRDSQAWNSNLSNAYYQKNRSTTTMIGLSLSPHVIYNNMAFRINISGQQGDPAAPKKSDAAKAGGSN